ncbi:MAG: hypothetical protein RL685_3947 [Pseudomonadota bacterium]|jgi:hypothetical protein
MRHQAAHLRYQSLDRNKQRRPARIGEGGDQNVARLEVRVRDVPDDAGTPLDDPAGDRRADERACRQVLTSVRSIDGLALEQTA